MPFLILAVLVVGAYVVGNVAVDGMYAARGMTPPRIEYRAERDAAKATRTGKAAKPRRERGRAFRDYWANLWRDSWEDASTRRADRRADQLAAYRMALTAGQAAREAAREAGFGMVPRAQTAAASAIASLRREEGADTGAAAEQPAPDPLADVDPGTVTWMDGKRHQWNGAEWELAEESGPISSVVHTADTKTVLGLRCLDCGTALSQAADGTWEHPDHSECSTTPRLIADSKLRSNPPAEGITAMTGEAINYETTVAAYEEMLAKLAVISDRLNGIDTAVTELQATAEQITAAGTVFNLNAGAVDGAQDVIDHLSPDDLHDLMTRVDNATSGVTAARDHVISTYGDAADIMAATGTDGAFVNV